MVLIHRVVRREFGALPKLIRSAAGDRERAKMIGAHVEEMLSFLHVHHSGEDELLWPVLRPRVELDAELIDRMEAQHHQIADAIEDVQSQLPSWSASADAEQGERIAARLEQAAVVLTAHLAEEEERILPLAAEHMTPKEWAALGEHGFGAIKPNRRLIVLGHILEETSPEEQRAFMKAVPPPARVLWKLVGKRQFAKETARIRG
jgi:hemerythrin-like domain-containing protein